MKQTFINYMFGGFYQIGYVTKDRDKAIKFFQETMGVPKFMTMDNPKIDNQTYHGKKVDIEVNLAFGQMGNTNIEIIQPTKGESTYTEMLEKYDWIGMHHMAVKVFDYDKAVKHFADKDMKIAQTGELGEGTKFGYVDTVPFYGHFTEILYYDLEYEKIFDSINRGDF